MWTNEINVEMNFENKDFIKFDFASCTRFNHIQWRQKRYVKPISVGKASFSNFFPNLLIQACVRLKYTEKKKDYAKPEKGFVASTKPLKGFENWNEFETLFKSLIIVRNSWNSFLGACKGFV